MVQQQPFSYIFLKNYPFFPGIEIIFRIEQSDLILFIFSIHLLNSQILLEYIFQCEAFQGDKGMLSVEGDAA